MKMGINVNVSLNNKRIIKSDSTVLFIRFLCISKRTWCRDRKSYSKYYVREGSADCTRLTRAQNITPIITLGLNLGR